MHKSTCWCPPRQPTCWTDGSVRAATPRPRLPAAASVPCCLFRGKNCAVCCERRRKDRRRGGFLQTFFFNNAWKALACHVNFRQGGSRTHLQKYSLGPVKHHAMAVWLATADNQGGRSCRLCHVPQPSIHSCVLPARKSVIGGRSCT